MRVASTTPTLRDALVRALAPPVPVMVPAGPIAPVPSAPWLTATADRRVGSAAGGAGTAAGTGGVDLDALVVEYTPAVYRLARSVVRDPALADDVTQETFIKVWKHLDDYRGEGSLRGWVLRIAHNTAVSTLRRIKDTATAPDSLPEPHDPLTTNRVVEGRLAQAELVEALERLDELSRGIVVLREVEGLSYEEIAEALDVPVPTVKTRLLRARRRLAVALDGWRG